VATEILMPQLGMGMFEGTIVSWIVADGAAVRRGEGIVEIQTEKVIHTIEAPVDGIVQRVAAEGSIVPIRGLVGCLLAAGEPRVEVGGETRDPSPTGSVRSRTSSASGAEPRGELRASPVARTLAKEHGLDLTTIVGSGPGGRIVEKDVHAAVDALQGDQVRVSPVVRRIAEETDLDLTALRGTGPGGRITNGDVERRRAQPVGLAGSPASPPIAGHATGAEAVAVVGIRRVIFERMAHSSSTVARVTEFVEVDATNLVEVRTLLKSELGRTENLSVGYNDLLIMIAAKALREHRLLNSTFVDGEIKLLPQINIGLAVDTERGLLVPVVRNADSIGLLDVVREVRALMERAQMGRSLPEDLTGGTFTISNLGMYEIDGFTPIVNLPECAILGVGRIVAKPAVLQGEIAVRQMMVLSLSFDHRIVDGAPAARFLQQVKNLVEKPYVLL
jgi:pyruvate dehydrogenase E2 component (dihydrolipoamide acetyltransferase)